MDISVARVRRLIAAQFPEWAELPVERTSSGLDTAMFRLGSELAVRMPRRDLGARHLINEQRWLELLGPRLPLLTPVPLGKGVPGEGFPWPWTVASWLPGDSAFAAPAEDSMDTATRLAEFVTALQEIDPSGGPHGDVRGDLQQRDEGVRFSISASSDRFDGRLMTAIWEEGLAAPTWRRPGVWIHSDLHPGNLLVEHGRLSAVIDFGLVSVGDPACDLMPAWTVLRGGAQTAFLNALHADEAMWVRGRAWAAYFGLLCVTHPQADSVLRRIGIDTLDAVAAAAT